MAKKSSKSVEESYAERVALLTDRQRESLTNFVANASTVLGVAPAIVSGMVAQNAALFTQAIGYQQPHLQPIAQPVEAAVNDPAE